MVKPSTSTTKKVIALTDDHTRYRCSAYVGSGGQVTVTGHEGTEPLFEIWQHCPTNFVFAIVEVPEGFIAVNMRTVAMSWNGRISAAKDIECADVYPNEDTATMAAILQASNER